MKGDHPHGSLRRRVYIALEGGRSSGSAGMLFETTLIVLIIANVVAYIAQSIPAIEAEYGREFFWFEYASVAFFTAEYLLRLWSAPEDPHIRSKGPIEGRFYTATRTMMIVDLLAFLPSYFMILVPYLDLRVLRLFRLLRLLKIARYSPALSTLAQVIKDERRALYGSVLLMFCAVIISASLMHAIEGRLQPKEFGTIPDAMWWAITTLTTVGYGDTYPTSELGRVIAGLTMITGLGLFALPVGIIATGFVENIHRKDFVITFGMLARVPLFQEFDARTLSEIMDTLRAQAVPSHGIISARGERAAAMYFVVSGQVEAQLADTTLRFAPGDFFGEMALLTETMRAATIVAVGQARLLALSTEDFDALLRKHPSLRERLTQMVAERAEDIAEESGISTAEIEAARRAREHARHTA
ncbi:MAG TPA: cyclic nucleotide-gated ion channel [Rhizomicrobium sp.]|jgi:voltage-gated potassium channel|nr:cyclic nucleotide-gated ion channel [Rhizomicrobium sp.]